MISRSSLVAGACALLPSLASVGHARTPVAPPALQNTPATPDFVAPWEGYDTAGPDEGRPAVALASADLDGDGDLDVLALHGDTIPRLAVLRNEGAGRLAAPVYYDAAHNSLFREALDVGTGDFDGDGDVDVVTTSSGIGGDDSAVHLFRNGGDGTLAPFVDFPTTSPPAGLVVVDADGDGRQDVVTADYGYLGQGASVSLLLGTGAGFAPPVTFAVPSSPYGIETADLDGDGDADLAVACEGHRLSILRNDGSGGFTRSDLQAPSGFAGDIYPCVALGDVDGDGDVDALYSSNKTGTLSGPGSLVLFRNQGAGTFAAAVEYATLDALQGAVALATGDWNGDGVDDVVGTHLFGGKLTYLESDGAGGLAQRFVETGLEYVVDALAADLDGDGIPELLTLQQYALTVDVWRNDGSGEFAPAPTYPMTPSGFFAAARDMATADLEGDGDLDVVCATWDFIDGEIAVLRNQGDGTFAPRESIVVPEQAVALRLGDLNGDGLVDIVWGDQDFPGEVHSVLATSSTSFGPVQDWPLFGYDVGDLALLDFEGDGDLDLAMVTDDPLAPGTFTRPLTLARNDGTGVFGAPYDHDLSDLGDRIHAADVDGDGLADLITDTGFGGLEVCLSNGDGTFGVRLLAPTNSPAEDITTADLDGDGVLDIATGNYGDGRDNVMSVAFGSGNGLFSLPVDYPAAYHVIDFHQPSITHGDVDGDGDVDLVLGNAPSSDVSVYRNQGDGTFARAVRYGVGGEVFDVILDDVTGDGRPDCLAGHVRGDSPQLVATLAVLAGTGATPWRDLGLALPGSNGAPQLTGQGALVGGGSYVAELTNARANAAGVLVVATTRIDVPLFGGTLVPAPELLFGTTTDAGGAATLTQPWPPGIPFGLEIYSQVWLVDPGSANGRFAASNALLSIQY